MLLEDLNWMDVEDYLKQDDRIILVTGACEQHGYLSLLADVKAPMAIAAMVAARENVLVAPPINFGVSPYFAAYPGTISLSAETFLRLMREVIECLRAQGFKRILIVNGHGGNKIGEVLIEIANARPGLKLEPGHANRMENFRFTRVAETPDGVKPRVTLPAVADAAATDRMAGPIRLTTRSWTSCLRRSCEWSSSGCGRYADE